MAGHHRRGNNGEIPERDHQDFEMDDSRRQLQQLQGFTRMKGEVPDIIIQNLKLLAMMKRRIHFTVPLVISLVGALHPILVILETYNEVMI